MGHIYYNDKRILVGETRKPKDNEFIIHFIILMKVENNNE